MLVYTINIKNTDRYCAHLEKESFLWHLETILEGFSRYKFFPEITVEVFDVDAKTLFSEATLFKGFSSNDPGELDFWVISEKDLSISSSHKTAKDFRLLKPKNTRRTS